MLDLMSIFARPKRSRPKSPRTISPRPKSPRTISPRPKSRVEDLTIEKDRDKFEDAQEAPWSTLESDYYTDEQDEQEEDNTSYISYDREDTCSESSVKRAKVSSRQMERRYNAWLDSIKSYLDYVRSDFASKHGVGAEPSSESVFTGEDRAEDRAGNFAIPQTEEELNNFLRCIWKLKRSKVPKEVTNLKVFYVRKLRELTRNYAERTKKATKSGTCVFDELYMTDYTSVKEQMKHFERLQFELKNQVVRTIIHIMPYSVKVIPFRSIRKHSERVVMYLNKWFLFNIAYPYPNAKDKEKLAEKCGISIQQVANWFSHKRQYTACSKLRRTGEWSVRRKPRQRKRKQRRKIKRSRKIKRRLKKQKYRH